MAYVTRESRYVNIDPITDPDGLLVTPERVPFRFEDRDDNWTYTVKQGDTWRDIAEEKYSAAFPDRACGLFWVLLDYQVPPVVDPTIEPRPNSVVVGPSAVVVDNEILGARREEFL